jgi:hypothetical protein
MHTHPFWRVEVLCGVVVRCGAVRFSGAVRCGLVVRCGAVRCGAVSR